MTFFALPLRTRGIKRLNKWILPITLILKERSKSFSRPSGSLPLLEGKHVTYYSTGSGYFSQVTNRAVCGPGRNVRGISDEVVELAGRKPSNLSNGVLRIMLVQISVKHRAAGKIYLERFVVPNIRLQDMDVLSPTEFFIHSGIC